MDPEKASLLETPWRPLGIGTHLGLTISLDSELHEYYCSSTLSAGFKVSLGASRATRTVPTTGPRGNRLQILCIKRAFEF